MTFPDQGAFEIEYDPVEETIYFGGRDSGMKWVKDLQHDEAVEYY